jgi:hypothetical protein
MRRIGLIIVHAACSTDRAAPVQPTATDYADYAPTGDHSIESRLRIPKYLARGRYTVQCEAWVRRTGRLRTFICYSANALPHNLMAAVIAAGRRGRFAPATRDGVNVDVYMMLMVSHQFNGPTE